MSDVKQIARVVVWDPVVRYGHWLLVAMIDGRKRPAGKGDYDESR